MTTSLTHFPVANPSNHGAGGSGLLDPGTGAAANSNFALVDANATASDDDVLAPSAASPSMTTQFVAVAPPPGEVTPPVAAGAIGIPGQNGDPQLEVTTSGSGLVFYDTFTKDDTLAFENCVIAAEKQYEGIITNNVTLHMTFDMGNKGDTDFNHFSDGFQCNYATLKAALLKRTPNEVLPAADPSNGGLFNLAPAYARMLGLTTSAPTDDAIVTFHSNGATWDFGQDVVNAVTHGISEAGLGRVSGMGASIDDGVVTPEPDGWEPLDLFRYTASGVYDSSDGKGNPSAGIAANTTDFFSSDGGAQTSQGAGLSFTNLFAGAGINPDAQTDADDWRQQAVFGINNPGETNTLTATDLNLMSALGWKINLQQQVFTAISGTWESPSSWANGYNPIAAEDVAIGDGADSGALLDDTVTVNSIAVSHGSSLTIDDATLTATDGTVTNSADTYVLVSGNLGVINVGDDATLTLGGNFSNAGTLNVRSGGIVLINGDVDLSGPGVVNLFGGLDFSDGVTIRGGGLINLDQGFIAGGADGAFTNVDDRILGSGRIIAGSFDNQAGGAVDAGITGASGGPSDSLLIDATSISNEGAINVVADAALILNAIAGTATLVNAGQINVASDAEILIGEDYTIAGAGDIVLDGAGAYVASESANAWTLTNKSTIEGLSSEAEVGQNGASAEFLELVNQGSIIAEGFGAELIVSTGANVISDAGGLLEAEEGGHLVIDSAVHTGSLGVLGGPAGGVIEAASSGVVTIASAVSDGIPSPEYSLPGQISIDGGTVEFLAGSSDSVPIVFTGADGVLEVHSAATLLGAIQGVVGGDAFLVTGTSLTSATIGASSLDIDTNSGAFDFANVLYGGAITGYVAFADPFTAGLERVLLTDGNVAVLEETDKTVYEDASSANIIGEGDTVDFQGSAASTASIFGTSGEADKVNGSGGVINLYDAQAQIVGVSDTINFVGTTGNAVSLFATGSHFDTVSGADGIVYLDGAQAHVLGGADTVHFESGFTGNQVVLQGAQGVWDTVQGSGGLASLDDTWAKVAGGGDTVDFLGASGNEANLYDTAGVADTINGSNGTVFLNSSQASIVGGGDTVDFSSGSGNVATLSATGSNCDVVEGAAGTVDLHGATAKATNNGDTFAFAGANTLNLVGTAETMAFSQGIGGLDAIAGVGSSDLFQFSSADFANFAALLAHTTQSGANTVIALNASDKVTLDGVSMSSLSSTQFKFV